MINAVAFRHKDDTLADEENCLIHDPTASQHSALTPRATLTRREEILAQLVAAILEWDDGDESASDLQEECIGEDFGREPMPAMQGEAQ